MLPWSWELIKFERENFGPKLVGSESDSGWLAAHVLRGPISRSLLTSVPDCWAIERWASGFASPARWESLPHGLMDESFKAGVEEGIMAWVSAMEEDVT